MLTEHKKVTEIAFCNNYIFYTVITYKLVAGGVA